MPFELRHGFYAVRKKVLLVFAVVRFEVVIAITLGRIIKLIFAKQVAIFHVVDDSFLAVKLTMRWHHPNKGIEVAHQHLL